MSFTEKYRPQSLDEIVGQEKVVRKIKLLRDRGGLKGRVFWMVSDSGQGKTSLARIIAHEAADDYAIIEKDAQIYLTDFVNMLERMCETKPLGEKGCHVFICNEAHRLSDKIISRLQSVLEEPCVQRNSTWIFTTTRKGAGLFADAFDACPFLSRAIQLNFETRGSELELAFAVHVRKIAQAEGCDGKPIEDYVRLVRQSKFNLRQCLNQVESGVMLD